MNLYAKLLERKDKPLRIGVIGAGKFGAMYIAQVPRTPGVHLVGIADLSPDYARKNLERVGWPGETYCAPSLDAALKEKRTHLSEDWEALVAHPAIDIIIESTGNPPAAVEHALAAFRNGKHVVMVTVEADAFCGPLLARKAAEAGVVYSLAYGDQPALICDLVDWARAAGFPVVAAGRGHKWLPHYAQSTPETVWGYYGLTPEQAQAGGLNPEDVQLLPRRLEAGDRDHRGLQRHRAHAGAGRPRLPAGLGRRNSVAHAPAQRRRRAASQGTGGSRLLAYGGGKADRLRHPLRRVGRVRGRDRLHPALLHGVRREDRPVQPLRLHVQALASDRPRGRHLGRVRGAAARADGLCHRHGAPMPSPSRRKDLKAGEMLDGEGGYTVVGKLMPAQASLAQGCLPLGLAHGWKVLRPVAAGQPVRWSDVAFDERSSAVRVRREMERAFAAQREAA